MVAQNLLLDHLPRLHPGETIVERDPGSGNRCRAGAAVGLDDVAVDGDLPLAERSEIDDGAQAAPDQALDFDRASVLLAREASRRVRSSVARGSMPYSAVIQPRAWPLSQGGKRSSSVAVTSTWVSPNRTKHEPSANFTTPRSSETGRNSSGCRQLGRMLISPYAARALVGSVL